MKGRITFIIIPLLLLLATAELSGQEPLPRGFADLLLGLSLEDARSRIEGNSNFMYRGGPDVSLRPFDQERSIETEGRGYMERGAFHFDEGTLYIITLFLNRARLDYFTLYRTLEQKYGSPDSLTPERAIWENEQTLMSLERPLTVKYVDRRRFEARISEGEMQESLRTQGRDAFLGQF